MRLLPAAIVSILVGSICGYALFAGVGTSLPFFFPSLAIPPFSFATGTYAERIYSGIVSEHNIFDSTIRLSVTSDFADVDSRQDVLFRYDDATEWVFVEYVFDSQNVGMQKKISRGGLLQLPPGAVVQIIRGGPLDGWFHAAYILAVKHSTL